MRSAGAVVALTLAGLALGSRWAGRRADVATRPLRVYALLEGGIALWAFGTPLLFRILVWTTASLPDRWGGASDLGPAALLVTALLVLPGTFLMGATTPFIVRTVSTAPGFRHRGPRSPTSCGVALGAVYGWNTAGASAGALSSIFFFLPALGMGRTLQLAASVEILVASVAAILQLWADRGIVGVSDASQAHEPATAAPRVRRRRAGTLLSLFFAGAAGGICQIAWTRMLVLLLGSSAHALGLALGACLAGLAFGSTLAGRALRRGRDPGAVASVALLAVSMTTLLPLPVWGRVPVLVSLAIQHLPASFFSVLFLQALLAFVLLTPPAAALGAILPALSESLEGGRERTGKDSGDGYALDTWGSVAGSLVSAFILLPRAGAEAVLRGGVLLELGLFALLGWTRAGVGSFTARSAMVAWLWVVLFLGVFLLPRWDPDLMTSGPLLYGRSYAAAGEQRLKGVEEAMRRRGRIRFLEEGAEATVTVREGAGGLLSLQINGKTDASTGGDLPTQLLAGHLPAFLHPAPRTALVIGLASGVTAGAVGVHGLDRIDCVEISPEVARAARLFSAANRGILSDPRFHLFLGDGRAYLSRVRTRYDLIVSQPSNPWVAGITNLFTRQFFLLARDHLAWGGMIAVWVQGYALDPGDFQGIAGTFLEVFPNAQLWEESPAGGDYFLVARRGGAGPTLDSLEARLHSRPLLRRDLARAGVLDTADLLGRLVTGPIGLSTFSRGSVPVTDDNLRLEFTAPRALWDENEAELTSELERVRQSPLDLFAVSSTLTSQRIRASLEKAETRRRARISLALSLRRADREALAYPSLSTAVGLVRAGLGDAALPFLRLARAQAPQAPAVPLLTGWLLLDRGDLEGAGKAFEEASALDQGSAEPFNGLGLVAWRSSALPVAASLFRRASELAPTDPDPANNLASVLLAEGRPAEALTLLDKILGEHPEHVPARINRGVALARLGRPQEAVNDYLEALRLEPLNADAAYNLRRAREREEKPRREKAASGARR